MFIPLSIDKISYCKDFKNVTNFKEENNFKTSNYSMRTIEIFLASLHINKNYICIIKFIPSLTKFNIRSTRNICDPFLINSYSNAVLINKLMAGKLKNKLKNSSLIIISYWEIKNIER